MPVDVHNYFLQKQATLPRGGAPKTGIDPA